MEMTGSTAIRGSTMKTIHLLEKTGKDGVLSLRIPLGQPDAEFEVVIVAHPGSATGEREKRGWPEGYFRLAGSITDDTFVRPPQGELPRPVEIE
jgi:hypothetical protein